MKLKSILFVLAITCIPILSSPVFAHELIPKELQSYIENYPNASPEEIKAYADSQAPEFSKKFRDGVEIVNIVRNQNTSFINNAWDFLKLGVGHILSGLDHILFVLSLLLVFFHVRELLKLTATFTVAHSITLILSGLGIITLSPSITEPLIALSIAHVAIATVFFRKYSFVGGEKGKLASIFFFGLFHGLGFAGLLTQIKIPEDKFISSLFSFNIGIEIGQLFIIALALPFIFLCRNKKWYPRFIQIFAVAIALLAVFWFVQRIV